MAHTNNRSVQHRPRRESKEVEVKTEMQELRSENQKLRRENARLRRECDKLVARSVTEIDQSPEPEVVEQIPMPTPVAKSAPAEDGCPNGCNGGLRKVVAFKATLVICPVCHWRRNE